MISVIIPSYNRYEHLLNAIKSVKQQTYNNYEIIVVNDGSSDIRYQSIKDVKIIHLKRSSKEKLGYPCGAIPRNKGMKNAIGEYIAFLDDDDIWMPNKLEIQINQMNKLNTNMSCTDGYIGSGYYDKSINYPIYNKEYYFNNLIKQLNFKEDFPDKFNSETLKNCNPIITSSVMFKKEIINKIGYMELIKNGGQVINGKKDWQDWNYWRRMLEHTDCLYIKEPLFYYNKK